MDNQDKKTILVVEDEEDVMDYLVTLFEDNEYNVVSADNGKSGFELAKAHNPDLISLDISMPGESGISLYKNLSEFEETKHIPVIIITGFSHDFKDFFEKLKPNDSPAGFFEKPIDRDALINKINEIMK